MCSILFLQMLFHLVLYKPYWYCLLVFSLIDKICCLFIVVTVLMWELLFPLWTIGLLLHWLYSAAFISFLHFGWLLSIFYWRSQTLFLLIFGSQRIDSQFFLEGNICHYLVPKIYVVAIYILYLFLGSYAPNQHSRREINQCHPYKGCKLLQTVIAFMQLIFQFHLSLSCVKIMKLINCHCDHLANDRLLLYLEVVEYSTVHKLMIGKA